MSSRQEDYAPYEPEDAKAQLEAVSRLLERGSRVVDLGAGNGRVALPLAAGGRSVLAVDNDPDALGNKEWEEGHRLEILEEDFLGDSASWMSHAPFDGGLCLGNTLALFLEPRPVALLFERVAGVLEQGGLFLVDDFPVWGWDAVDAGDWQSGTSADGLEQMAWIPGKPLFAYKRGSAVDPAVVEVMPDDRLLRLWSLPELDGIAGNHGFKPARHDPEGLLLIFERAGESSGTSQ